MSLPIILGTSGVDWKGDANGSGQVLLYRADGTPIYQNELFRGLYPIVIRQSSAAAAGQVPWAIYNQNGTRKVIIKNIFARAFFDGTAAATLMKYELAKGTGVTVFSGGTTPTPLLKRTSATPISALVRVLDTGLTLTGVSWPHTAMPLWIQGRVTQTTTNYNSLSDLYAPMSRIDMDEIELANQEVLAVKINATAVIGDNLVGFVDIAEV